MKTLVAILLIPLSVLADMPAPGTPGAPNDPRYCGEPARYADGTIKRSQAVLNRFVAVFPCPATLEATTSCPGWQINHIIPLASGGGCDAPLNLMWAPVQIKTCATWWCIDRWERTYHSFPRRKVTP